MPHVRRALATRSRRLLSLAVVAVASISLVTTLGPASAVGPGDDYNTAVQCEGKKADKRTKLVAFDYFALRVNGETVTHEYREISKYLDGGDRVTVEFQLKPECDDTYVGMSVFELPSNGFDPARASEQKLRERVGRSYAAGVRHSLQLTMPTCWFQLDVNTGWEYLPGDFTLDNRGRLLLAGTGGSGRCVEVAETTPTTPAPTTPPTTTPPTTTAQRPTTTRPPATTSTTATQRPTTTRPAPPTTVAEVRDRSANVDPICSEDASGWTVTFRNDGNVRQDFTVRSGSRSLDTVSVPAGEEVERAYTFASVGVADGAAVTVEVFADGESVTRESLRNDCAAAEASIDKECDTVMGSGAVLTMSNTGEVDEVFTVTRDGREVAGSPFMLPAGERNNRKLLPLADEEVATITVTGQRSGIEETGVVQVDCVDESDPTVPDEVLEEVVVRPQLAETGFNPAIPSLFGTLLLGAGAGILRKARNVRRFD